MQKITEPRWCVEVRQPSFKRVEVHVRSAYARRTVDGHERFFPFQPGEREIIWRGAVYVDDAFRATVRTMVHMWEAKFGVLRFTYDHSVNWTVHVGGKLIREWWTLPYTPRIATCMDGVTKRWFFYDRSLCPTKPRDHRLASAL